MTCQRPMTYGVSKDPPPLSSFIGASLSTPLSGTKWKNNLVRLSRKWNSGSRQTSPLSGTAAAAATEKLIRRPKTSIQTEDLTASQFAFMAGIKIKRGRNHQDTDTSEQPIGLGDYEETDDDDDDDDTEDDDDDGYSNDDLDSDTNTNGMLGLSLNHRQLRQLTTKVAKAHSGSVPGMTSYSSLISTANPNTTTTTTTTRCHPIWDARFWQQNQQQQHQQQHQKQQQQSTIKHQQPKQKQQKDLSGDNKQQQPSYTQEKSNPPSSLYSTGRSSDLSAKDTLSSATSSLDTCLSVSLPSAKPRVLHKGRFQIVLGDHDTEKYSSEPLVRTISSDSNNNVVEWHRKRAMTQ